MVTLHISEELARKLNELAARENRPVEEVLEALVKERRPFSEAIAENRPVTPNPLLLIAQAADQLGDSSELGNLSEMSREILRLEFPQYLVERLQQQDNSNEKNPD